MQLIITFYFWLMFILVTIISIIIIPFFLLFNRCFGRKADYSTRWAICIYGWILVKLVPFLAPIKVESRAGKLPLPAIFVPNHNSAIDPYLFGALLKDLCFITSWSFKIPVYNFFMHLAKYINANEGWQKVCQESTMMLQSGTSLIIWPEGHRSRDGRLGRFKNGAFFVAVKTGYPLVPVCILGSGQFLPPGKRIITPSRVKLILLDPIYPDMNNDQEQEIIRLRNLVREVIKKTLQEEQSPSPTAPYSRGLERGEIC